MFEKFHPLLLQQICYYSYYEDLEQGIIRAYQRAHREFGRRCMGVKGRATTGAIEMGQKKGNLFGSASSSRGCSSLESPLVASTVG